MKRILIFALAGLVGLTGAGALVIGQTTIPRDVIERSVNYTPAALTRAWEAPVAATFGNRVDWQSNASLCGPASLANVFRSLGEPAVTEAHVLAGTGRCRLGFCFLGLTLDELADVARAHTARTVSALRDLSAEEFRQHMRWSNEPDRRYVVNFYRAKIFGAGVGHHAPIGGYLEAEDLVLVLDVNPNFGPWLIELPRLYDAVDTLAGEKKRGLLLIER